MPKKGVSAVSGITAPIAGKTEVYNIVSWYPATPQADRSPLKVTWELFLKRRNGKFTTTNIKKTGKSDFTFGEGAVGETYRLEAYLYSPEGGGLIIKPQPSKIPRINKVELFYVDDTKGTIFNFNEILRARANCVNMLGKDLIFTLWEDDATGGGHNTKNLFIDSKPAKVNKNGVATIDFSLTTALMLKAARNEGDTQLEFYVTVEYFKNNKHATQNVNIKNPYPSKKSKPNTEKKTVPDKIPKAKGSPAEKKPDSKKEQNGISKVGDYIEKEIWDWFESKGIATKKKLPTVEKPDGKATAEENARDLSASTICECEQMGLIWGKKVECKFRKKVVAIAKDLWPEEYKKMANNMMAVFAWETGETFKPDVPNRAKSGATGLIQFMPARADEYFGKHTIEIVPNYFNSENKDLHNLPRVKEFASMEAVDQLDYVAKYFEPLRGKKLEFVDFYLQVLFPISSEKEEHFVFGKEKFRDVIGLKEDSEKTRQLRVDKYDKNDGMDINKDGKISRSEISLSIQPFITKGLPEIYKKGEKLVDVKTPGEATKDVVVTDAGHGINSDGGNINKGNPDNESKMTLLIEAETSKALIKNGIKNVRTRTTESLTVKINQITYRSKIANDNNAKVFISHHLDYVPRNKNGTINENAAKNTNKIGINIHPKNLTGSNGQKITGGSSEKFFKNSSSLAQLLVVELKKIFTDRVVVVKEAKRPNISHDYLGVLKNMDAADHAAVLIELGNTTDQNTLFLTNNKIAIGNAIAQATILYLGKAVINEKNSETATECQDESPIKGVSEDKTNVSSDACNLCNSKHYDLTAKNYWQSQYDKKWGTKIQQDVACKKACDDIMIKAGLKATIPGSKFQVSIENKGHTQININNEESKKGIAYMDSQLKLGNPLTLGVDHKLGYGKNEGSTDHFVVVVGKGCENGKIFYRFYDVGTAYKIKGASSENRLYLNKTTQSLTGKTVYNGNFYTVTQIRKN